MAEDKKPKIDRSGDLVRCLRCGRSSRVQLVAKCRHCGSFAVKLIPKGSKS